MTQWTPQQLKCLAAIGVPVYAHVPSERVGVQAESVAEKAEGIAKQAEGVAQKANSAAKTQDPQLPSKQENTTEVQPATPYYYQLGPWVFEFEQMLPVESFDWLRDLAAYCKSTPAQVSQAAKPVKLDKYARNQLPPAAKKELWQLLKAAIA